jgi:type I restriction enzyme S subunit
VSKRATSLWRLARYENGFPFRPDDFGPVGTPVIRIRQLVDSAAEADLTEREVPPRYLLHDGDLVFSWSGSLAVTTWTRGPAWLNQHLFKVIPAAGIDQRWLRWTIEASIPRFEGLMHGSAMTHLTLDMLKQLPVDEPSLDEQRRIAGFLDAETARIDRLDELAASTAGLLAERRRVLIEQVIVDGSASTRKLFRGLHLLRDGTHQPPPRTATGVPLLTARNVSSGALKLTDQDTFVSSEDADVLEASLRIRNRDVLLSVKGTVGAIAIVPAGFPRAVLDRNLALLRPQPSLLNEWLVWALRTRSVQDQMKLSIAAAAQPGLPLGAIRELRIPAADIGEQKRQVREIELIDQQLVELESKIRSQRDLLAERRQALITAAIAGAITV